MNIKYIGTLDTKVRVNGQKIDVAPNDVFEMEEKEAKALLAGPYRSLFIEEGAELTPKQNPENNKAPTPPVLIPEIVTNDEDEEQDEEDGEKDVSELLARIANAESIDALNEIATEVANDETVSELDEVNEAIEAKMQAFLVPSDNADAPKEDEAPKTDAQDAQDAPKSDETVSDDSKAGEAKKNAKNGKNKAV